MSWRKKTAIKLLLILLITCLATNLSATQMNEQLSAYGLNQEISLEKGALAPYTGVLVPYPQYYYYNEQVEINFRNETRQDYESEPTWASDAVKVLVGLLLGIGLTSF